MDNKPYLECGLLIPIGIGLFSIVGIFIVGLIVFFDEPPPAAPLVQTATPFKYILLATETRVPTQGTEETPLPQETIVVEPTSPLFPPTSSGGSSIFPTDTPPQVFILPTNTTQSSTDAPSTLPATLTNTPAASATSGAIQKYDDTDEIFNYDLEWQPQTGVANAYQGTLMVSDLTDNAVDFDFVGQQIVIGYLGGPGLGSITISIDDDEFLLDESSGNRWVSPQFPNEEHFVIIFHETGDSVNLDYIEVLGAN